MKNDIENIALEMGADDIGFSSPENYISPNTPVIEEVYPGIKTIIVLAFQQLDNSESEITQIASLGRKILIEFSDSATYKVARYIKQKYKAKVIPVPFETPVNKDPETNIIAADISLRHAARGAGLGNFGRHNIIVHPMMGSKVIFTAILTDLEIQPDTPLKEELCLECIGCDICVKECPVHALDEENKTDVMKCIFNMMPYGMMGTVQFLTKFIESTPEEQKQMMVSEEFKKLYDALTLQNHYICFNCIKNCPIGQ